MYFPQLARRTLVALLMIFATAIIRCPGNVAADTFESDWDKLHDRIWPGADYWPNPMENWAIRDGRLECTSGGSGRNCHILTAWLDEKKQGAFSVSVRAGMVTGSGKSGTVGLEIGVHDELQDYRGYCFFGKGILATIDSTGRMRLGKKSITLNPGPPLGDIILRVTGQPEGEANTALTLQAINPDNGQVYGTVSQIFPSAEVLGNIALVQNPNGSTRGRAARFGFSNLIIEGKKVTVDTSRRFGPILWSMYTMSNSRGKDGRVVRLSAQMPPVGEKDSQEVQLQVKEGGQWKTLKTAKIDPDARTARFRLTNWDQGKDTPFRLLYNEKLTDGTTRPGEWLGVIRAEPTGDEFVLGSLTCQNHYGFPYGPVPTNLKKTNPDMLYFSGDQIYENNGGFGIIRTPDEPAIVNYLRKYYMFGWAFGDVMRDRPTVCLPDDHDVFHGNLWGEAGGDAKGAGSSTANGYVMSPRFVNAVHRTQTWQNPDLFDPTPVKRGITVMYGDMLYGGVSFAIIADRQFKSGPNNVDTGPGRSDWVNKESVDVKSLDKPGLVMLGQRQHKFLDQWVRDWRGADMKVLLSQTIFANAATHHGGANNYLIADLDSGGWPQTPRDRAIRSIRRAFPVHINGDQHISSLIQYGVDQQRDSFWSFCTPAIAVGYPRWWNPDRIGRPYRNRPDHGLPNTGEYLDGFGNKMFMYAIGNPPGPQPISAPGARPKPGEKKGSRAGGRYALANKKASGFSLIRINHPKRTYTFESYRFLADLDGPFEKTQYPGWPHTIQQADNYGRKRAGTLGEYSVEGVTDPVVLVTDEKTGELVYALRFQGKTARPWVFEPGSYTVRIGDPDKDIWQEHKGQALKK